MLTTASATSVFGRHRQLRSVIQKTTLFLLKTDIHASPRWGRCRTSGSSWFTSLSATFFPHCVTGSSMTVSTLRRWRTIFFRNDLVLRPSIDSAILDDCEVTSGGHAKVAWTHDEKSNEGCPCIVSLTIDAWFSRLYKGYLAATMHWVDWVWILQHNSWTFKDFKHHKTRKPYLG